MAIRQYDFITGIETASPPSVATPTNDEDIVSKGYADDTYARRASWYDKSANNAAIKAITAADRANGQIVFNYGTDKFYKFDSASSATDDGDMVLQPDAGSGRWLAITSGVGSASGDTLIQTLDTSASTSIVSGQNIAANDAICLEIHNGSGSNVYRYFKTDADLVNRKSFCGFAISAASGTSGIYNYTISAAYVSGNVIPITINGRSYSTTYASTSDATLQALATLIGGDPDVASAVVTVVGGNQTGTDDRVIVITAFGHVSLNITGTTVTSGASQPTVTISNPTPPVGVAVDMHQFGPMAGFTSLTPGEPYFLSGTAGGITATAPLPGPIYVGRALTSTVLFVDPFGTYTKNWGSAEMFFRYHGFSGSDSTTGTTDGEKFNFASWSSITSSGGTASSISGGSDGAFSVTGETLLLDGSSTSTAPTAQFRGFNKSTWTAHTGHGTTTRHGSGLGEYNSLWFRNKGEEDPGGTSPDNTSYAWDGATWASKNSFSASRGEVGQFYTNSLMNVLAGYDAGSPATTHETKNTSDTVSSATVVPEACIPYSGANRTTGIGIISNILASTSTRAYEWNGSSWSSLLTAAYSARGRQEGTSSGFAASSSLYFQNGGSDGSAALSNSQYNNSGSFVSSTSSGNARGAASSGCF